MRIGIVIGVTISVIAFLLLVTLILIQDVTGAAVSLVTFVLGLVPWIYDRLRERQRRSARTRNLLSLFSNSVGVIRDRFPALVGKDLAGHSMKEPHMVENILVSHVDEIQQVVDEAIDATCDSGAIEELGREVLHHLVLHALSRHLDRRGQRVAKSIVRSFLGDQIIFMDIGPAFSPEGETFIKVIVYLRTYGRILDFEDLRRHLRITLDPVDRNKVAMELGDPQLSFLVYELGKDSDLLELVQKEMSGRRVMRGLSRRAGSMAPPRRDFDAFLVLKQEKKRGDRYLKDRIDKVPDRIVASGWLFQKREAKSTGMQSISILSLSSRHSSVQDFIDKHFPGVSELKAEELRRASLVVIPLATEDAEFYPKDPSVLRPAQRNIFRKWWTLFKKERKAYQELLADFDVSFLDVVDYLSFDFLAKNISKAEKEFLRAKTDSILLTLGINSPLDISGVSVKDVSSAMIKHGYPSYEINDIVSLIDSYVVPLREFLDTRLAEISREVVRNSRKIVSLKGA